MIIDSLCHLDRKFVKCEEAIKFLFKEAKRNHITNILLCNIPGKQFDGSRGYSNQDFIEAAKEFPGFFHLFPGLNPQNGKYLAKIKLYKDLGARGIKFHPRLHNYKIDGNKSLETYVRAAGKQEMPVIICGFPDGINLMLSNYPESFGRLATRCPETKILMAHAGGHRIIDSMMVMKRCENLYLDLSFTLLYYRGSNVMDNIKYVINSCKGKRILWGTDYPDRPYPETIKESMAILQGMGLNLEIKKRIFESNPLEFLGMT